MEMVRTKQPSGHILNKLDRWDALMLKEEIEEAIRNVCRRYGVRFRPQHVLQYDPTALQMTIRIKTNEAGRRRVQVEEHLAFFHKDLIGRQVQFHGEFYKIIGYDPDRGSKGVLLERNGQMFAAIPAQIYKALGIVDF